MVSVIVPVYNTEKYLRKCIDSIIAQTYKDLEIILVDDGSTDSSGSICDGYALKDPRVRVVHKENGGLASARKAGIGIAKGEYVGFVDSDDWIEPDMYRTLYEAVAAADADIAAEGAVDDFEGECAVALNGIPAGVYASPDERKQLRENMLCCADFFCMGVQPYLWNKLFRRGLVLRHMPGIPEDITVGEDAAAVYPMLAMADKAAILGSAHYHYCRRRGSMTFGSADEEREYSNAARLQEFLEKSFMGLGIYGSVEGRLCRYGINSFLTRAYGMFAESDGGILFPFQGIRRGDSVIIYGAGALGRAVYRYASGCGKLRVKALADRQAELYKKLGLYDGIYEEDTSRLLRRGGAVFRGRALFAVQHVHHEEGGA